MMDGFQSPSSRCRYRAFPAAVLAGLAVLFAAGPVGRALAQNLQLGVGVHYWKAVKTITAENFNDKGAIWSISARINPASPVHLGLEVEQFPKNFGGAPDPVYVPAAYLVVGRGLYTAVGFGGYYTDGGFTNDRFYAFRAGLMFPILPGVILDGHANYRFEKWKRLSEQAEDIRSDTITLGAALRIEF